MHMSSLGAIIGPWQQGSNHQTLPLVITSQRFPLAAAPAAAVQTTKDDWPIIYFPRLANSQLLGPQSSQRAADPPPAASVAAIPAAAAVQTTLDVWPIAEPQQ